MPTSYNFDHERTGKRDEFESVLNAKSGMSKAANKLVSKCKTKLLLHVNSQLSSFLHFSKNKNKNMLQYCSKTIYLQV